MKDTLYVGTILTAAGLKYLQSRPAEADWVELRLDAMRRAHVSPAKIRTALQKRKVKVLLTLRAVREGGLYPWKRGERAATLKELLPQVDGVDFELASLTELQPAYRLARKLKKMIVLSGHSIKRRVPPARLREWVKAFEKKPADLYKLAVRVESPDDLFPLAVLLCSKPEHRWAVMGVGPMAAVSRRILTTLGSRLAYGYLDKPAAPGQPSLKALRKT